MTDPRIISEAIEKYEQPVLLYDRAGIKRELDLLRSHLHRAVRGRLQTVVLFSIKANPNLELLKWFASVGVGAEVSSMPEFEAAQSAGMNFISATSPGLSVDNISTLYARDVRVNIDNPTQLQGIPAGAEIGLRLCLPIDLTSDLPPNVYSRFGLRLDDLSVLDMVQSSNCRIVRLHSHFRDIGNAAQLRSLASRVVAQAKTLPQVKEINLGGGMTRLYKDPEAAGLAWDECAPIFDELSSDSMLMVEPGAQLLTGHGYLGTRVVSVTEHSDGRKRIVVNSSKWNLVCWSEYELVHPKPADDNIVADIVGPTCYEKDVWATNVRLPAVYVGQQLIFRGLGAYVASMARKMHGLSLPEEVLL